MNTKVTYKVLLSTDGKHTVIVETDDPDVLKGATIFAIELFEGLVDRYGLKTDPRRAPQPRPAQPAKEENGASLWWRDLKSQLGLAREQAPVCQVHQVPMNLVQGKRGSFYSCHQRNADGSFCSYRPLKAA